MAVEHRALGIAILDLDAVDENAVEYAVARFQSRTSRSGRLSIGVVERVVWDVWVE